MALTFADIFGPQKDQIGRDYTAKAAVLSARTAQRAYPSSGSAVATPEFTALKNAALAAYESEIAAHGAIQDGYVSATGEWIPFLVRYLKDNDSSYEGTTTELGSALRSLLKAMIVDDADIDASTPTAGTVVYDQRNQGAGTATIAINSDTTVLAELALAGTVKLTCTAAGFSIQNAEVWQLTWVGVHPRTGLEQIRTSQSRNFRSETRYFDVAATSYPAAGTCPTNTDQLPQRGSAIHTGLNILVSIPAYNTVSESGDPSTVFANYNFRTYGALKTNLSRKNTTASAVTSDRGIGIIYIRCTDLVGSWSIRAYSDSGLTNPITEALTFIEGAGDQTLSLITSAPGSNGYSTNGEHVTNGGHLPTGSTFMQVDIDDSAITAEASSFTVTLNCRLPFAVGDVISCPITNSYAGLISRYFVQEFGFALRTIADGSETIADPA